MALHFQTFENMNIVVLDGYTLNPGDLSWQQLQALGKTEIHDFTHPETLLARAKNAEALITNKVRLDEKTMSQLPQLKYIGVSATGYNVVDVSAAARLGITVTNVPNYGNTAVAQHVFALLLTLTNRAAAHSLAVHAGEWNKVGRWCFWQAPIIELNNKTMGIVGLGGIGQKTAQIARSFGMRVLAHRRRKTLPAPDGVSYADLEELFAQSDVVSLHLPLSKDNEGFVNTRLLSKMKPSAYLINTARGQLINQTDLADALNQDRLAGAGLDVLHNEPPLPNNPLLTAKNCIITPHNAWGAIESRQRLMDILASNLQAFIKGEVRNVVALEI